MDKKSGNKNDSNLANEEKLNRLKSSIKGTLTRLEAFTSEKTVSKDAGVTKKLSNCRSICIKWLEIIAKLKVLKNLETIQQDIEDINAQIEKTEVGLKLLMNSLKNTENGNTHTLSAYLKFHCQNFLE
ncbi:DUF1758 domain-containing protein [Trichonephila clavata]|uniref:DUF1758 domain-containing protein n=1 Tax=Trichonephila clavata TaxID=2740835 RepID=A0A8X6EZ79_TRICU|nr:DUF1758 domain-containing protein [Trichonephila clavata]